MNLNFNMNSIEGFSSKPARKKRVKISNDKTQLFEEQYNLNATPTAVVRKQLSHITEIAERSIQIWFQNRRAKAKVLAKQDFTRIQKTDDQFNIHERPWTLPSSVLSIPLFKVKVGQWTKMAHTMQDCFLSINPDTSVLSVLIEPMNGLKFDLPADEIKSIDCLAVVDVSVSLEINLRQPLMPHTYEIGETQYIALFEESRCTRKIVILVDSVMLKQFMNLPAVKACGILDKILFPESSQNNNNEDIRSSVNTPVSSRGSSPPNYPTGPSDSLNTSPNMGAMNVDEGFICLEHAKMLQELEYYIAISQGHPPVEDNLFPYGN